MLNNLIIETIVNYNNDFIELIHNNGYDVKFKFINNNTCYICCD